MTPEKLTETLRKHKLWLDNNGGERAILSGADLSCAKNLLSAINFVDAHTEMLTEVYRDTKIVAQVGEAPNE